MDFALKENGLKGGHMLIEELTSPNFESHVKEIKTVIIPLGSIEEHGAHLPLGTDYLQAYEMAKVAAIKRKVFVAPPIPYGLCRSTSEHPGTLSISFDTLRSIIIDIVESLYKNGLRYFIIFSGHAGGTHTAAMIEAGECCLKRLEGAQIAVINLIDIAKDVWYPLVENKKDSHAGEVETSLMLYLRPHLVLDKYKEEYPSFPKGILVRDKKRYWPGGVWGDPTKASVEKGKKLFDTGVNALIKLIDQIENNGI